MPYSFVCASLLLLLLGLAHAVAEDEHDASLAQTPAQRWKGADIACDEAMEKRDILNGPQLFRAAEDCASNGTTLDAVFLLLAGQVRALADLSVLQPQTESDEIAMGELYGAIHYGYGGSGPLEMHRDADSFVAIIGNLRNWDPSIPDGYDPGWDHKSPVDRERYRLILDYSLRERLAKLQWYNKLLQDDRYFAAKKERDEILVRIGSSVVAGTDDANRLDELLRITDAVAESNPYEAPPLPRELQQIYTERDPEARFRQLHAGFDGVDLDNQHLEVFESSSEVRASWLSRTLSPVQFASLLEEVNFETESLIVFQLAPQGGATGSLDILVVDYTARRQAISVSVVIGVNDDDCDEPPAQSYPFVVASIPKVDVEIRTTGTQVFERRGKCQPPMYAQPTSIE